MYSNFGYSLLGRIIEQRNPGLIYTDAMQASLFTPLGVTRPDLGRSLVSQKAPGEVRYHPATPRLARSVVSADRPWVTGQHGGWEPGEPRQPRRLDRRRTRPGEGPRRIGPGCGHPHHGRHNRRPNKLRGWFRTSLPDGSGANVDAYAHNCWVWGASCRMLRRSDGLSFAVLLNGGLPSALQAISHGAALNAIANDVGSWPRADLFLAVGILSF